MPKTVVEKFNFSKLKIEKVKFFTESLAKIFCIGVFNVEGCIASCFIFNVRSLATWLLVKTKTCIRLYNSFKSNVCNVNILEIVSFTKKIIIYNNTFLVCQGNFVAAIASYLHVFNTHSIKTNTTTHVLKLLLTSKRKLHKVMHQPRSLDSFTFRKT